MVEWGSEASSHSLGPSSFLRGTAVACDPGIAVGASQCLGEAVSGLGWGSTVDRLPTQAALFLGKGRGVWTTLVPDSRPFFCGKGRLGCSDVAGEDSSSPHRRPGLSSSRAVGEGGPGPVRARGQSPALRGMLKDLEPTWLWATCPEWLALEVAGGQNLERLLQAEQIQVPGL